VSLCSSSSLASSVACWSGRAGAADCSVTLNVASVLGVENKPTKLARSLTGYCNLCAMQGSFICCFSGNQNNLTLSIVSHVFITYDSGCLYIY
jgi:hypothetical protein